ncbi:MAG: zinc finger Ran-binding domain-containing protein [Actinomycetota bacterium]|nr:zinc finger Ran-binding domain-containing protein [Actinomycetota bacterium]
MPEIDADLFEFLTLVLLGLVALLLLFLLGVASGVKKTLQRQLIELQRLSGPSIGPEGLGEGIVSAETITPEPEAGLEPEPGLGPEPAGDLEAERELAPEPERGLEAEPTPSFAQEEPVETAREPLATEAPAAAAEPGPAAEVGIGAAEGFTTERAEEEQPAIAPEESAEQPAPATADWERQEDAFAEQYEPGTTGEDLDHPFAREPAATHEPDAGAEAVVAAETSAAESQDQPFERNGRWYFRRGDELLRYEEGTGEWVAAEEDEIGGRPSPVGAGWAEPETTQAVEGTGWAGEDTGPPAEEAGIPAQEAAAPQEAAEPAAGEFGAEPAPTEAEDETGTIPQPAVGGFWKCASCGAVNGSSAATCRMCFSPRP